jgi:hypothetical protein
MVRNPKYSFIQFEKTMPQSCCVALPVSRVSDLAFYVYADFKFTVGIMNSSGEVWKDVKGKRHEWYGSCVDGKDLMIYIEFALRRGECFHVVLLGYNDAVMAVSNRLQYVRDTEHTSVVQYSLDGGLGFEWDCLRCLSRVRLPLHLTEPQYPQEQEVYRLKSGYRRHLFAEIEKTYNLKTDFLPEELHQKLVIALSHDEVYINDILLTKAESYSIDWGNTEVIDGIKYAMASAGMVENVTARNDNCGVCVPVPPPYVDETIEFSDYVCQTGGWRSEGLLPFKAVWSAIAYGNGRFVALSSDGFSAWSVDGGVTWQGAIMMRAVNWVAIAYGNGRFVAVEGGSSNKAFFSSTGSSWTEVTLPGMADWTAITYGNGRFVALSSAGFFAWSVDGGVTWEAGLLPSMADWSAIAYGGGRFVAVARGSNKSLFSSTGLLWDEVTLPAAADWTAIVIGLDRGAAVATNGRSAFLMNFAAAWSGGLGLPSVYGPPLVAYGNGMFVIVSHGVSGAEGLMYVSGATDGLNWTKYSLPYRGRLSAIAFGGGKFIAVGGYAGLGVNNIVAYFSRVEFSGKAFATTAEYERYEDGRLVKSLRKSMLTDVEPALTETKYRELSESDVKLRVAEVANLFEIGDVPEYANDAISDSSNCRPAYSFRFSNGNATTATHAIAYNETFTDTITSTKDGSSTAFMVSSRPSWAFPSISGNTVTVTSNNTTGASRTGTIVYQQIETGSTIVSYIQQAAQTAYSFTFSDNTTTATHAIAYNETFTDTIVSTKDGSSIAFTVLSKPSWATITINGNTVTVTSNNTTGAARTGTITYQQAETGTTIVSNIQQAAQPQNIDVTLGFSFYTRLRNAANSAFPMSLRLDGAVAFPGGQSTLHSATDAAGLMNNVTTITKASDKTSIAKTALALETEIQLTIDIEISVDSFDPGSINCVWAALNAASNFGVTVDGGGTVSKRAVTLQNANLLDKSVNYTITGYFTFSGVITGLNFLINSNSASSPVLDISSN